MITKPVFIQSFENWLGRQFSFHPNVISSIKLFIITPLLFLSLKQVNTLPNSSYLTLGLFLLFCTLDYLDGIVARVQNLESRFGRLYDRLTDYPLLYIVTLQCVDLIPLWMLLTKLTLDTLLFIQYLFKSGTTENRIRTSLSYTTLIALLVLSQGWAYALVTEKTVIALLSLNIFFSGIVILYNARIIQKRFIADTISMGNLTCGIASMYFASLGKYEFSLLLLIIGGVLDGLDGAAARRWGGTRFGVYSDDIADGVNYGIAPGVALFFAFPGIEGIFVGAAYSLFTIARLVYFTLNHSTSDPNYFRGVPSTAGGLIVLCAIILFRASPLIVGLLTGMAMVLMVSFDAAYLHLGRAVASGKKRYKIGLPVYAATLILFSFIWGMTFSIKLLLVIILLYGLTPALQHFYQASLVMNKK